MNLKPDARLEKLITLAGLRGGVFYSYFHIVISDVLLILPGTCIVGSYHVPRLSSPHSRKYECKLARFTQSCRVVFLRVFSPTHLLQLVLRSSEVSCSPLVGLLVLQCVMGGKPLVG